MSLGYWETLAAISGSGNAVTNSTSRTSLLSGAGGKQGLYTLPPNKLRVGDVLHLFAQGHMTSVITTPGTFTFDLSAGVAGTALFSSLAILPDTVQAHTQRAWILDITGTVRVIGNAANIFWGGLFTCEDILGTPATPPKGTVVAVLPWNVGPPVTGSNVDLTIAQIIDFNITMTVATATTECQLYQYVLSLKTSTGF